MSSAEWTESGTDTSGVGRLGYDDTAPSELMVETFDSFSTNYAVQRVFFI
jgi:hypothetical protein